MAGQFGCCLQGCKIHHCGHLPPFVACCIKLKNKKINNGCHVTLRSEGNKVLQPSFISRLALCEGSAHIFSLAAGSSLILWNQIPAEHQGRLDVEPARGRTGSKVAVLTLYFPPPFLRRIAKWRETTWRQSRNMRFASHLHT